MCRLFSFSLCLCVGLFDFHGCGLFLHQGVLLPHRHGVERDVLVFQVQFGDVLRIFGAERDAVGAQARDFHLAKALADEAQFACGGFGEVYDVTLREGASVGHLHDHFLAVDGVPHPQHCPEGVVHVCAGHAVAVIFLAVAHRPSV